ncbi:MAG: hypothetical protein JW881_19705 [Spirochaetales bacterium]|nr:hypothetical protein [Spirochaetales bacterium]
MNLNAGALGDANNYNKIDIVDALVTTQYYVGEPVSNFDKTSADVDCNNVISIIDALLIAQYYVGVIYEFPCPTTVPTQTPTPAPTPVPTAEPTIEPTTVTTQAPTPVPGAGEVWTSPSQTVVNVGDYFQTEIHVNSGDRRLAYFDIDVWFDKSIIRIDTSRGTDGVAAGSSGFFDNVWLDTSSIEIEGRNTTGTGPGTNLHVLTLYWQAIGAGMCIIENTPFYLDDPDNYQIGLLTGTDGTVEVKEIPTPDPTPDDTGTPAPTRVVTPSPTPEVMLASLNCDIEFGTVLGTANRWIPHTGERLENLKVKITGTDENGSNYRFSDTYQAVNMLTPLDPYYNAGEENPKNIMTNRGDCMYIVSACYGGGVYYDIVGFELDTSRQSEERYVYVTLGVSYSLSIASDGYLSCETPEGTTTTFCIRVVSGSGRALPGDDLLLRFGLTNYPEFSDTVGDGDFMAVYDKRLLDAANMYVDETIDEGGSPTGLSDWNGAAQIPIRKWIRFNDNCEVGNAVAYGWGCWDSVDMFNTEVTTVEGLSENVTEWYGYTFPAFEVVTSDNVDYYKPVSGSHSVPQLTTYAAFGDESQAMLVFRDAEGNPVDPDGGVLDENSAYDKNYNWRLAAASSGTDCSGFVSRCALLSGTNYKIVDIDDNNKVEKEGTGHLVNPDYTWEIADSVRSLIVPGDIIVKKGHVAIVLAVDFPDGSRDLGANILQRVSIIHSTSSQSRWRVRNDQDWSDIGSTYKPRRLIIE